MQDWSIGVMEYWEGFDHANTPSLHDFINPYLYFSITPILQYSITPVV